MNETLRFLNYVFPTDAMVEMRLFTADGTILSGRFDDLAKMAAIAQESNSWAETTAVYFTINPIAPDRAKYIGDWSANFMKAKARSTRDADVDSRLLYLIDVDPSRPSGICATDEEKAAALEVATTVQAFLTERGWPEPIVVDSGNGYHLYYLGDGCNASSKAWVHVLKYLAEMFDTAGAKVDTSVGNASRISRLPGSINRKGENSPERPHRRARVLSYPEKWEPVSHGAMIYSLASEGGFDMPTVGRSSKSHSGDMPELLLDDEGVHALIAEFPEHLHYSHTMERGGLTFYVLEECPFVGRRHPGDKNKTALTLSDTTFGFKCLSDDCAGKGWQELKKHLHDLTGRWPQTPIYDQSEREEERKEKADERVERWFEVEYRRREKAIEQRADWQHDRQTWDAIESGAVERMTIGTDPAEWGLTYEDVWLPYFYRVLADCRAMAEGPDRKQLGRVCCHVLSGKNIAAMGDRLGKEALFFVVRNPGAPAQASQVAVHTFSDLRHHLEEASGYTSDVEEIGHSVDRILTPAELLRKRGGAA